MAPRGDTGALFPVRYWSPADYVSNARILAAVAVAIAMIVDCTMHGNLIFPYYWLLWLAIGLSDKIDGTLARRFGSSKRGATNDEQADKIVILLGLLLLCGLGRLNLYLVLVMVVRDVAATIVRSQVRRKGSNAVSAAKWLGKLKTTGQFTMIVAVLIPWLDWPVAISVLSMVVTVLSVVSGLQIIALGLASLYPGILTKKSTIGVPNWLAIIRFSMATVVPYTYIVKPFGASSMIAASGLAILLFLTDIIDGYWARRTRQVTKFGELFDPFADKAAQYGTVAGLLVATNWTMALPNVWWLVAAGLLLVVRDIGFLTYWLVNKVSFPAGRVDKNRGIAISVWVASVMLTLIMPEASALVTISYAVLIAAIIVSMATISAALWRVKKIRGDDV
jgi:phosphatidylglycerophosphate synthase